MAKATLNKRFEELFHLSYFITEEQLESARTEAERNDAYLHQQVVDMRFAEMSQVLELAQQEWGVETIDLSDEDVAALDVDFVKRIFPEAMASRVQCLPLSQTLDTLYVAMVDPFDVFILNEIRVRMHGRHKVKPYLAFPKDIDDKLTEVYGKTEENALDSVLEGFEEFEDASEEDLDALSVLEEQEEIDLQSVVLEQASQSFVIRAVTKILFQAIREGASDIHIEPFPRTTVLRYRIDGDLQDRPIPNHTWHAAIISRIKIVANMNIAERRVPQDGRMSLRLNNKKYELRISMVPTVFSKESVVMRILDKSGVTRSLPDLGFRTENLARFDSAIRKPHGLILVSGPTGSGKSTTLFAALNAINSPDKKILTIENPVEYNLPGIVQVETKENIEPPLTFVSALRAFLRQDPDVIMIGEMRDYETASIAVQAALTGHLVFSTIHTNDAPTSVTRLLNFEVDPFLIGDAVLLVIAQRLPHTICENCKVPAEGTDKQSAILEAHNIDTTDIQLSHGKGCDMCNGKGMKGRMAIHEVMEMAPNLREMILQKSSAFQIRQVAIENGMRTLRQDGLEKAVQGLTTIDEIMGMTQEA